MQKVWEGIKNNPPRVKQLKILFFCTNIQGPWLTMVQRNISSSLSSMVQYEKHSVETVLWFLNFALFSGSGCVLLMLTAEASLALSSSWVVEGKQPTLSCLLLTADVCWAWCPKYCFSFPTFRLWWVYRANFHTGSWGTFGVLSHVYK